MFSSLVVMSSNPLKAVGGALANIATFGGYGANKAAKKQASAANAMADAMANAPEQKVITTETKDVSQADAVNSSARRRLKLSNTTNRSNPLSSLAGLRKTLG